LLIYDLDDRMIYDRGILNVKFKNEPLQRVVEAKRSDLLDLED